MNNSVKAVDTMMESCCNICNRKFKISHSKITEEIFTGPQIQDLMRDTNFDAQFSGSKKAAWEAFKVVVHIFLGKHKAPNYKTLVENMHKTLRNMGCNMTLKLHFLLRHLVPLPLPQSNLSDVCYAHTERLHRDISTMEN
jgi:hypothetical protein